MDLQLEGQTALAVETEAGWKLSNLEHLEPTTWEVRIPGLRYSSRRIVDRTGSYVQYAFQAIQ